MPANATKIEEIDARILEILGLSDAVDLEFDEYKTLLKESMMKGRMGGSTGMSTEDVEKVTDEWKRVKNETGTFKVKSKAADFVSGKKSSDPKSQPKPQMDPSKLLPGRGGALSTDLQPEEEDGDETGDFLRTVVAPSLDKIKKSLENILNFFKKQEELEERRDEKERVGEEKSGKKSREAELEETKEGPIKKTLDVVSKPVKGFFDMIWDFLKNILLGGALLALYDILKDPTKFVNNLIGMVNGVIGFLNNIINTISGPLLSPFNLIIDAFNTGMSWWNNSVNSVLGWFGQDPSNPPNPIPHLTLPNIPTIKPLDPGTIPGLEGGGEIVDIGDISFTEGGGIDSSSGITINGMGKDTQLIAAQPGEIMFSNPAVNYWGADTLLGMNKLGGGTNIPKMGNIQPMQGGGVVIGAGHAPSINPLFEGKPVGDDGRSVQGTREYAGSGVYEYEATRHLVNTLKRMIPNTSIAGQVSFENITAWKGDKGLRGLPKAVESRQGAPQFIDLHFDARGGRGGVLLPHQNQISAIDRAFLGAFGKYPGIEPQEKGITDVGGTIVELGAINDPNLGPFLREVERNKVTGPHSTALATKVINALTQGLESQSSSQSTNSALISKSQPKPAPVPPPSFNNGSGNTTIIGGPGGGSSQQSQSSATSADQAPAQSVSSQDFNNAELFVIKSIYNIIG